MNEPFAGNPLLLIPGVADLALLQPFYDAVAEEIRAVDNETLIMFESVTWDDFRVGFTHAPNHDPKTVLSFHYYNPPNVIPLKDMINHRIDDARRLRSGLLLSEFDMSWGNGSNVDRIRDVSRVTEESFLSYIGWTYVEYLNPNPMTGLRNPDGTLRPDMAAAFSRPYASAVPGVPLAMAFDDDERAFSLRYRAEATGSRRGPVEIRFCEPCHFLEGFDVDVKPRDAGLVVRHRFNDPEVPEGVVLVDREGGGSGGVEDGMVVEVRVWAAVV
ncbi:hypothetical protein DFJ73DRAFT_804990 [Zopfochytrium polystomum]|nr:hypothetical protein DFJ73DRAFT_804990 [Zopfochytrium polystomum]